MLCGSFGCKTIKNGTSQEVSLRSNPPGVQVIVDGEDDEDDILTTPAKVKLDRSEDHVLQFVMDGYVRKIVRVKRVRDGDPAKGIVEGVGAVADKATGGAYRLEPSNVNVDMVPIGQAMAKRPVALPLQPKAESPPPVEPSLPPVQETSTASTDLANRQQGADTDRANPGKTDVIERVSTAGSGDRYAVVIGVAQYEFAGDAGLDRLAFADKDAQDFADTLVRLGWSRDNVKLLTNKQANRRNVGYALETWLRRAGKEDTIVLFWSGHAWPDPEDQDKAYFACYDSKPSDPSSGWRMDNVKRMLEDRKPKNVIVVADTCHSGMVMRGGDSKSIAVRPALDSMERKQEIPKGWIFIASAEADRKAYEDKAWKNGALTHLLLEGLGGGKADGYKSSGAADERVTLRELQTYVSDRMANESLKVMNTKLVPLFFTTSGDPGIWDLSFEPPP